MPAPPQLVLSPSISHFVRFVEDEPINLLSRREVLLLWKVAAPVAAGDQSDRQKRLVICLKLGSQFLQGGHVRPSASHGFPKKGDRGETLGNHLHFIDRW